MIDRIKYMHSLTREIRLYVTLASVSMHKIGLVPILQVLETIAAGPDAYSTACEREQFWIDKMGRSGAPLLN